MRALITGGAGFLGRHIVAALRARGVTVVAPSHAEADLLTPEGRRAIVARGRAELLVHAAWITRPGEYWQSPRNLDWAAASIELARRFAALGGRRVVFIGTCAEYEWRGATGTPWPESRPCRPHTPYGAAKLLAWTSLRHLGIPAVNARVFWPVGPGEHPDRLLPGLVRAALGQAPLATGPAALTRDLIDVRDAGEAIALLALSEAEGAVNIGAGRAISLGALAEAVAGRDSPMVRLGARPARPGEPLVMLPDIGALRRATGFVPRIPLARTIADARVHWRTLARAA